MSNLEHDGRSGAFGLAKRVLPVTAGPAPGVMAWRRLPVGASITLFGTASGRFAVAVFGPTSISMANAILQFVLLKTLPQAGFGLVAFILGLTQFGFGLSNALVGTPHRLQAGAAERAAARIYHKANLVLSGSWGAVCALAALTLGSLGEALLFGCFATLAMIRWFARSQLYALHRPSRVAISDITYAAVLLIGAGAGLSLGLSLRSALAILCAAALGGLLTFGRSFLHMQFVDTWRGSLRDYHEIWRDQARWTLLGVVSSEATSNAHAYAVSLIAGPAAFAPIAAASLLVKPIMLVMTSLTQMERPVMARRILAKDETGAGQAAFVFRGTVLCAWIGTIALATVLLLRFPTVLLKATYDLPTMELAFAFWAGITLLQCWSAPSSVMLQAAQWFEPLALVQTRAALGTVAAVGACMLWLPPVFTLLGILAGQMVTTMQVEALARRWSIATRSPGASC